MRKVGIVLALVACAFVGGACKGGKTAKCDSAFVKMKELSTAMIKEFAKGEPDVDKKVAEAAAALDASKDMFLDACGKLADDEVDCLTDFSKATEPKCQEVAKKFKAGIPH